MLAALVALTLSAAPTLEITTNPYASTYGVLRAQAEKPDTPTGPLADGINKLKALESTFPDRFKQKQGAEVFGNRARTNAMYWRAIDQEVYAVTSVDGLRAAIPSMPAKMGENLATPGAIESVAGAVQPALDAKAADAQVVDTAAKADFWKSSVAPKIERVLQGAMDKLALTKAPKKLTLLIVPDMGGREAVTFRAPKVGPTVVVGAGRFPGHDFTEVVLHEVLHAIDDQNKTSGFFVDLERALRDAGVKADLATRTVHASLVATAAILTRANFDIGHIDVGDAYGTDTEGMAKSRAHVTQPMKDFFDGRLDKTGAINAIVAAVKS